MYCLNELQSGRECIFFISRFHLRYETFVFPAFFSMPYIADMYAHAFTVHTHNGMCGMMGPMRAMPHRLTCKQPHRRDRRYRCSPIEREVANGSLTALAWHVYCCSTFLRISASATGFSFFLLFSLLAADCYPSYCFLQAILVTASTRTLRLSCLACLSTKN